MSVKDECEQIALEGARRYGVEETELHLRGGFLNRAYEYEKAGKSYILRVSYEAQRSEEMVLGEVEWLRYLAANGLAVAQAVPSLNGKLVEVVEVEGKRLPLVVFEKAPGRPPGAEEWNQELFLNMGSFLGKMHRLTLDYKPTNPLARRPLWSEELDEFSAVYLPAVDEAVQEKYRAIRTYPEQLAQTKDAYGLVHIDFHRGNFFVHQGQLTLFDFDDSQYSWFVEDLAMCLFYAVSPDVRSAEELGVAQKFYDTLLQGYYSEYNLDRRWLQEIPHFLKKREMCLYLALSGLGAERQQGWAGRFMTDRRAKILNDIPYIEIKLF